ncbi:MAG: hypothetical protein ACRD5L_15180 [Bryobacteraceae bacterium]
MVHPGHRIKEPSWSRQRDAVRPPACIRLQPKLLNRNEHRLIGGTLVALIPATGGLGGYPRAASAEARAGEVFEQGMAQHREVRASLLKGR